MSKDGICSSFRDCILLKSKHEPVCHKAKYEPGCHKPVPMQSRVIIPEGFLGQGGKGTVVGISAMHVVFTYIVLLDCQVEDEYGIHRAVCVPGPNLKDENGNYAWRLET